MNIYELSYAAAVMCYRNIDVLEERHSVCGKADEKLYDMIYEEFCRRFDMLVKVLTDRLTRMNNMNYLDYTGVVISWIEGSDVSFDHKGYNFGTAQSP